MRGTADIESAVLAMRLAIGYAVDALLASHGELKIQGKLARETLLSAIRRTDVTASFNVPAHWTIRPSPMSVRSVSDWCRMPSPPRGSSRATDEHGRKAMPAVFNRALR